MFLRRSQPRIASIFAKSIFSLSIEIIRLRYLVFSTQNLYLLILISKLASLKALITRITLEIQFSRSLLEEIRASSIYTLVKLFKNSLRTLLINDQNVASALQRLKNIARHLNYLYYIINTIRYLYPSIIQMQLKIAIISRQINQLQLASQPRVSLIRGKE